MAHEEGHRFRRVGGNLALDFVNTVGGREHENAHRYSVERDRIETMDDLAEWAAVAELLTPAARRRVVEEARAHPRAAAAVVQRAHRLREALYRAFRETIADRAPDPGDLATLNEELATSRLHERLAIVAGRPRVVWDDPSALDRSLWEVARAAALLMTGDELSRVRQCGGESCGWLFLDTSRNRTRQWCDMRDCGNLAKVRRFRERQKQG